MKLIIHFFRLQVIPNPKERSSKWISTSLEEKDWGSDLAKYASAEYFTNNLLSTVRHYWAKRWTITLPMYASMQ